MVLMEGDYSEEAFPRKEGAHSEREEGARGSPAEKWRQRKRVRLATP